MTPILLDSIVAIVIILSTLVALFRGFVKEMLTIVNIAGAGAAAWFLGGLLKPSFTNWLVEPVKEGEKAKAIWGVVPPDVMASFLSYATVFFGVFIVLMLAGLYISGTVKALGLGPADRTLGAAFGAARGFLLVFLIYLPFGYFMHPEEYPDWAKHSISVPLLEKTYNWGNEYLKEGEPSAEGAEETPADPNSLKGRFEKMSESLDKEGETDETTETMQPSPDGGGLSEDEKELP